MKFHLLGSSAGKTVPRPFCTCRVCQAAIERGGRDLRTRTSLHIYPENTADATSQAVRYKVDLSPDTGHHMIQHRFNLSCLEHLLITHPHGDHFAPEFLAVRPSVLSDPESTPYLNVYGGQNTIDILKKVMPDLERVRVRPVTVQPFKRFRAGKLDVLPLRASHMLPAEAHVPLQQPVEGRPPGPVAGLIGIPALHRHRHSCSIHRARRRRGV